MTSTIWKFPAPIANETAVAMPAGAEILSVQMQGGDAMLWAFISKPDAKVEKRSFRWYGTGFDMPDDPGKFVGTVQTFSTLVFHLFEVTR